MARLLLPLVILALLTFARSVKAAQLGTGQLYADVAYLSAGIGPRPVGSVGRDRASDYIEQRFWSSGYSVERWPFSFERGGQMVGGVNLIASMARPCQVIVGAHYDSVAVSPGANDNASGVAVMLDVANETRGHVGGLNVCFFAFDGEDAGLQGSRAYAETLTRADRRELRGMLSVDMVGSGDILAISDNDPDMAERITGAAQAAGIVTGPFWRNWQSDDKPFLRVGVSAGRIAWLDDPRKHTPDDRIEYVSVETMARTSKLVGAILASLAAE